MLFALLQNRGQMTLVDLFLMFAAYMALLFVMLPVHELAHAFVADRLGDDTPRWHGRLRLNPFAHLDTVGSLMLVLIGYGYARPVPVNPRNFRNPRRDMALVALAGPLSNILMAAVSMVAFRLICFVPMSEALFNALAIVFINVFVFVNLGLAVFNLLPIPPLDGSRILALVLPPRAVYVVERYAQQIRWILLILIFGGALDVPLSIAQNFLYGLLIKLLWW